ncbi:ABC transporter substrate-binding protein [Aliikangiella sp. G2MR2-5]|uniref:substrate-binding periplasmic protein n=1 Tax=Aliikangiella sp. G2MR2-5 TaxID=2788943 RepID=UPI0018ABCED5|nr:transporter substrate-binding domain-containing protein [Aliikangiella sp. G2MR2-5]
MFNTNRLIQIFLFITQLPLAGDKVAPVQLSSIQELSEQKDCHLSLGISDWMPYQGLTKNGQPTGKQVELIQQIVKEVGCSLSYKSMSFPQGLIELQNGTVDFQMNASVSEERKSYSYFSIPYRKEFLLLYSTSKYLDKCQTMNLEALIKDGFKLGLQKGLVYGPELTRIQKNRELNSKIYYVDTNIQHVQLVQQKNLDGVVDDPIVVSYRSTKNVTGDTLSACSIVVSESPISLIFSKKTVSRELVDKFNRAIRKIQNTRAYQKEWVW